MTNAEKQEILNAIKAESQSVDELVEVSSLDNIKSLPALRGSELVSAPLTLLRKPADDAAATANASATKADNAAALANKAAGMASDAAGTANQAAETANSAAAAASAAAKQAEDAAAGVNDGLVGGMTAVPDEENDTVKLTLLGKTGTEIASVDIPGGTGGGGNTYNVTAEVPLESGYYVLSSAIGAVDEKYVTRNFAASLFRNIKYFTLRKLYLCRKWMQKRLQKTTTTGITLPNFDFLA